MTTQTTRNLMVLSVVLALVILGYVLSTYTNIYAGYDAEQDGGIYWAAAYYGGHVSDLALYKSDWALRHIYCEHLDTGEHYGTTDEGKCKIIWLRGKP
jgi:hypothetical protein